MKLIYNIEDKPKFGKMIVFALQQLLAIMAATIAVPNIVGNGLTPSAALFGAGVGTIVYLLFTAFKSPVFLGSSFAFIGSMFSAFAGGVSMRLGFLGLIIGAAFAGLVYVAIALIVKIAGVEWIDKLMPAVIIGPVVAIIGLSLAGNAIGDLNSSNYAMSANADDYRIVEHYDLVGDEYVVSGVDVFAKDDDGGAPLSNVAVNTDENGFVKDEDGKYRLTVVPGSTYVAILCGIVTLAVTMICSVYGKKMLKLIPFITGIVAGYAAASLFYLIGYITNNPSLMVIDYSAFSDCFSKITLSSFISVPQFTFIEAFKGFGELSGSYIATIAAAYIPVAFVVFAEHIADHKNLSSIIEKDLLKEPGLNRTLLGDGVGSFAGSLFGGCPNTTYGESIGCVAITKNASVATIFTTGCLAILISFITPFVCFLSTIPKCVMGGVCVSLYGFIAVSGLKMLQNVDLNKNRNLFVASVILISGIGGFTLTFGKVTITEVAMALILGILTNLLVKKRKKNDLSDASEEIENQIIK